MAVLNKKGIVFRLESGELSFFPKFLDKWLGTVYNASINFIYWRIFKMTKTELISVVADKTDFTKKNAEAAVNAVVAAITEALASGEKVSIVGFGTFEVKKKLERVLVNPATKQRMLVPPKMVVSFKPNSGLKDKVNGK
jgi:DNA-binding protein HU-beta